MKCFFFLVGYAIFSSLFVANLPHCVIGSAPCRHPTLPFGSFFLAQFYLRMDLAESSCLSLFLPPIQFVFKEDTLVGPPPFLPPSPHCKGQSQTFPSRHCYSTSDLTIGFFSACLRTTLAGFQFLTPPDRLPISLPIGSVCCIAPFLFKEIPLSAVRVLLAGPGCNRTCLGRPTLAPPGRFRSPDVPAPSGWSCPPRSCLPFTFRRVCVTFSFQRRLYAPIFHDAFSNRDAISPPSTFFGVLCPSY